MFDVSIQGDREVSIDLQERPIKVTKAMVRALNRSIASARTVVVREMARDTKLRSTDVRDALVMREAHINTADSSVAVSLSASSKRLGLIKFGARGPEPSRGQGRGVTYSLGGGRNRIPHAFIATMKSGHRGVFVRSSTGKVMRSNAKRQAIIELRGPSLGRVFQRYRQLGLRRAQEVFAANFAHELKFATSGAGGGSSAE